MEDDNSVLIKIKPLTYEHETIVYVPVFQKNFEDDGTPMRTPTFTYNFEFATQDQQMAASFYPDYILELKGYFNATTKPFLIPNKEGENHE